MAAGACYYGDGVTVSFQTLWQNWGGAILRSAFPECLWLIWHFSLNPSPHFCTLQLCLSSLYLYPSFFHRSNSGLPLLKYLSSCCVYLLAHTVHRCVVAIFSKFIGWIPLVSVQFNISVCPLLLFIFPQSAEAAPSNHLKLVLLLFVSSWLNLERN